MNSEHESPRTNEANAVKQGSAVRPVPPSVMTESKTSSGLTNTDIRRGSGETILVIDDQIGVRDVLRSLLKILGYAPLIAEDGTKGVALYREQRHQIKVVITDMMMSGIQGPEVIRQIRSIDPDARIVAMGGLLREQTEICEEPSRLVFLHKPMTAGELSEVLGRIMPRSV